MFYSYVRLRDATSITADPTGSIVKRAIAVVLAMLLISSGALAQDYAVDFAIDMHGRQDSGAVECRVGSRCAVRVDSLRLKFQVVIYRGRLDRAYVTLDGNSGCCLFEGAASTLSVVPEGSLRQHRLFVGQEAGDKSLVYIQNQHMGDLYLKFQFSK
jgi:hypothetical protein